MLKALLPFLQNKKIKYTNFNLTFHHYLNYSCCKYPLYNLIKHNIDMVLTKNYNVSYYSDSELLMYCFYQPKFACFENVNTC